MTDYSKDLHIQKLTNTLKLLMEQFHEILQRKF